jgi:hypothetical protein
LFSKLATFPVARGTSIPNHLWKLAHGHENGAAKKITGELQAGESELLYGMEATARWLGMTRGQV